MGRSLEITLPTIPDRVRQRRVRLMMNPTLFAGVGLLCFVLIRSHIDPTAVVIWGLLVAAGVAAEGLTSPFTAGNYLLYIFFRRRKGHRLSEKTGESFLDLRGVPPAIDALLVGRERQRRWFIFAYVVALFWIFTFYLGWSYSPAEANLLFLFALLIGSAIIPYSMMVPEVYERFAVAKSAYFWGFAPLLGLLPNALIYGQDTGAWAIVLSTAVLLYLLHFYAYALQRFLMGEKAYNTIILDLATVLLASSDAVASLQTEVPEKMREMMRYQRVFIVQPNAARTHLQVTGQAGDYDDVRDQPFAVEVGVTGRAFTEKKQQYFNDVQRCRFYYDPLKGDGRDDTRAEIATPIMHQDEIYGVLDVADSRLGVYGHEDRASLQVIAQLLGAVLATGAGNTLMRSARKAWSDMASVRAGSEKSIFWEVSRFALEQLGAQTIVYWPFTPGGFPAAAAMARFSDEALPKELPCPGIECAAQDPLIELALPWRPVFDQASLGRALRASRLLSGLPVQGTGTALLLPVGTHQDRFGLLLLQFSDRRPLTSLLRSISVSLAQAFANVVALVRYREVFYHGIGRPELDLHVLMNHSGTKYRAVDRVRGLLQQSPPVTAENLEQHDLFTLLCQFDGYVDTIAASQATLPPDFWKESLRERIERLEESLPRGANGRRPAVSLVQFDRRVEAESSWLKLALYRVIVEAAQNAARHGAATHITVSLCRQPDVYHLEVRNNGCRIPDDARERQSSQGIFRQLSRLEEEFRATAFVENPCAAGEVVVHVALPRLEAPPMEESI